MVSIWTLHSGVAHAVVAVAIPAPQYLVLFPCVGGSC